MKKVRLENGFSTLVFSRGDGLRVRWAEHLQKWRLSAPVRRRLAHPPAWYLDAEARSQRPTYGLVAVAIFCERVLWEALTHCDQDGREVACARRAFLTVRRKMGQMKYRGGKDRFYRADEVRYMKSSVAVCIARAAKAYGFVRGCFRNGGEDGEHGNR